MKHTLIVLLGLSSFASAATSVAVGNATIAPPNFSAVPIVDNAGAPIAFQWAAGTFAEATDFTASFETLASSFQRNGSAVNSNPGALGLFSNQVTDAATAIDGSDSFTGKPVYIVIADNTTFGSATDYLVILANQNWAAEIEGTGGSVSFSLEDQGSYSVVRGQSASVAADGYGAPFTAFNGGEALTFGVVPEPSAVLLGGLALLGGLVRRRR